MRISCSDREKHLKTYIYNNDSLKMLVLIEDILVSAHIFSCLNFEEAV